MAEHSRCQPGRPRPNAVSQEAVSGSPGLGAFHSAKSCGSRLADAATSSPVGSGLRSSSRCRVSSPYAGHDRTSNQTSPGPVEYACPRSTSRCMSSAMSGTWPVARGS